MEGAGDRPGTSVDARADDPLVVIRADEPNPGDRGHGEAYVRLRRWSGRDVTAPHAGGADAGASGPSDGSTPKRLTIEL